MLEWFARFESWWFKIWWTQHLLGLTRGVRSDNAGACGNVGAPNDSTMVPPFAEPTGNWLPQRFGLRELVILGVVGSSPSDTGRITWDRRWHYEHCSHSYWLSTSCIGHWSVSTTSVSMKDATHQAFQEMWSTRETASDSPSATPRSLGESRRRRPGWKGKDLLLDWLASSLALLATWCSSGIIIRSTKNHSNY